MRTGVFLAVLLGLFGPGGRAADWQPVTWNGEAAYSSSSEGWRAVVSITRARLMHFGPADRDLNLVLAPVSRENRNRLGGHRLWLGPQMDWKGFWPPPAAWEYREPAAVTNERGVLRLTMAATGDDWPQLTRTYHWEGSTLVCGAESAAGGKRPAQFIQILQVPPTTRVSGTAQPETGFPAGYVRLNSTMGPFAARFPAPAHASLRGNELTLRHTGEIGKFGFRPQPLTGIQDGYELVVGRGKQSGTVAGEPDEGFHAQVYLSGAAEAFVEIEQLSPLFAPGQPARFEMTVKARAR
jgi:hypothetical protein